MLVLLCLLYLLFSSKVTCMSSANTTVFIPDQTGMGCNKFGVGNYTIEKSNWCSQNNPLNCNYCRAMNTTFPIKCCCCDTSCHLRNDCCGEEFDNDNRCIIATGDGDDTFERSANETSTDPIGGCFSFIWSDPDRAALESEPWCNMDGGMHCGNCIWGKGGYDACCCCDSGCQRRGDCCVDFWNSSCFVSNVPTFNTFFPTVITLQPLGTNHPSKDPTMEPTTHPSTFPSINPSGVPSDNPSENPSGIPSVFPSVNPSNEPSNNPSFHPTFIPTKLPTNNPTEIPSKIPTTNPSKSPSNTPSVVPTMSPTNMPSKLPSKWPSNIPSKSPSNQPSISPIEATDNPSNQPTKTNLPTNLPTDNPTKFPSNYPSNVPTSNPSNSPTDNQSNNPSNDPSNHPTMFPSTNPTITNKSKTSSNSEATTSIILFTVLPLVSCIIIAALIFYFSKNKTTNNASRITSISNEIEINEVTEKQPKKSPGSVGGFINNIKNTETAGKIEKQKIDEDTIADSEEDNEELYIKQTIKITDGITTGRETNNLDEAIENEENDQNRQNSGDLMEGKVEENVINWNTDQVLEWLANTVNKSQYCEIFQENKIYGKSLLSLNHDILKEFGLVAYSDRFDILEGIKELKQQN